MDTPKVDPSLAEVRQWRQALQEEFSSLGPSKEVEEIHRRAKALMKNHGIELKIERPRPREEIVR